MVPLIRRKVRSAAALALPGLVRLAGSKSLQQCPRSIPRRLHLHLINVSKALMPLKPHVDAAPPRTVC
jgi:hypothetical protein